MFAPGRPMTSTRREFVASAAAAALAALKARRISAVELTKAQRARVDATPITFAARRADVVGGFVPPKGYA